MNITGAVAGNPRFQDLKTVLCTNMFNGQENLRKFHQTSPRSISEHA